MTGPRAKGLEAGISHGALRAILRLLPLVGPVLPGFFSMAAGAPPESDPFHAAREQMVQRQVANRGVQNPRVLAAMREVPRHRFVPPEQMPYAYDDRPLSIGHGQTISQPYIVAFMTELLDPRPGQRILEVGTGSGYQAAVLGALGARVFTIEIVPELARSAVERLRTMGLDSVTVREGDGYFGWPEAAPFDGIMVTCAADHIPPPLIEQLAPGGRLCLPVGGRFTTQDLVVVEKSAEGRITTRSVLPVRFVPLVRKK